MKKTKAHQGVASIWTNTSLGSYSCCLDTCIVPPLPGGTGHWGTLFIFMQVPKSASFKWPALSSNMLSGLTSLRRQKQREAERWR